MTALVSGVLGLILWVGSLLLLRLTPLTGAAFMFASFGLTLCFALLGWTVVTLGERRKAR